MAVGPVKPLLVWVVTDGRVGIENQARGLAEAIAEIYPCDIRRVVVPRSPMSVQKIKKKPPPGMSAPWPDLWIGCGRASLRYSAGVRQWSGGHTFVVQLQNPRRDFSLFDLVIAPDHDNISGENVLSITGATNRVTAKNLAKAQDKFSEQLQKITPPRLAVLLGGASSRHKFTRKEAKKLVKDLRRLSHAGYALMITTSRRTPDYVCKMLIKTFGKLPRVWIWCGRKSDGPNPYFAFLGSADAILATNDSSNLLSEAASAGKPLLVFKLEGEDGRLRQLYDALEATGRAKLFRGAFNTWETEPLNETGRAAKEVLRYLHGHLKARK